ncbi:MAG: HAD-IA family hydrolase [Aquificae bacterium]|nr:HAD-IA family hydrolase [Aquificota bacterium]
MRAVLFDLDGTLIDSAKDIELALRKTLKDVGLEEYMPERIEDYIGGGVRALLERVLGDKFREEFVEIFRNHYMENPVLYTKPYDGVPEMLERLKEKGYSLAVVSNKLEELSRKILEKLGLIHFFEFVAGGDTFLERKPSPVPIIGTLEILGTLPEFALVVGDTEADIVAGKGAGAKTALALWGYTKEVNTKPDLYLRSPSELTGVL